MVKASYFETVEKTLDEVLTKLMRLQLDIFIAECHKRPQDVRVKKVQLRAEKAVEFLIESGRWKVDTNYETKKEYM